MSHVKSAHLQALYARRREAEYNRIERTEAVNKYFDHWGKVTSRFESWTTPEYYQKSDKQLQHSKDQKDKQKKLFERQQRLKKLLEKEKINYDLELKQKENYRRTRRFIDTTTLQRMEEHVKEQQKTRRRLELEAKLYGHWRHGVDDENLLFASKSDHEVLAKLNWLDQQVQLQLKRERQEAENREHDLKMQKEINKCEELQRERQEIREQEIKEIRDLQEMHMHQLKEKHQESEKLKEDEKNLATHLNELNKELQLLEEHYVVAKHPADFGELYNMNKIRIYIRKRSEVFRNQIRLSMSILERLVGIAQNSEIIRKYIVRLEKDLEKENQILAEIESMYESEATVFLKKCEQTWLIQNEERNQEIKDILYAERQAMQHSLEEIIKKAEELIETRAAHLNAIDNSSERLKQLIQEVEDQAPWQPQNVIKKFSQLTLAEKEELHKYLNTHKYYDESDNNLSPRCYDSHDHNDINQASNSFNNPNLDDWQNNPHLSKRDAESIRTNSQRNMQVVTKETELNRPRFGRKLPHHTQQEESADSSINNHPDIEIETKDVTRELFSSHTNCDESDNNMSPRCYDSHDHNDINQASNSFNNTNIDDWQNNPHLTKNDADSMHTNAQRTQQVVTEETESNRPRYGRTHHKQHQQETFDSEGHQDITKHLPHSNRNESDNNITPRCFDSHDHNDINQASNVFNNTNIDGWQNNPHLSKRDAESIHTNEQRTQQVVTEETEANRARFGIKSPNNHGHNSAEYSDDWIRPHPYLSELEMDSNHRNAQRTLQVVTADTDANRPRFGRTHQTKHADSVNSCLHPSDDQEEATKNSDDHRHKKFFTNQNSNNDYLSQRDAETERATEQSSLQVVTADTDANRPRFGRTHQTKQVDSVNSCLHPSDDQEVTKQFNSDDHRHKHFFTNQTPKDDHLSHREAETERATEQSSLQVVTADTDANRPRFGRTHQNETVGSWAKFSDDVDEVTTHLNSENHKHVKFYTNQNSNDSDINGHLSKLEAETERATAQNCLQVVTAETEANRPRFGRNHHKQQEESVGSCFQQSSDDQEVSKHFPHTNRNESDNNLSPRCYDSHDHNDINQDSNMFNNPNLEGWQENENLSELEKDANHTNAQRTLQVVTAETELNRPRFGRKQIVWD